MRQARRRQRHGAIVPGPREPIDRPGRPDSRGPAASPPCRTPPPPHRLASGSGARSARAARRDTGSYGRQTRRARPPGAEARRSAGRATRCVRPDDAPATSGKPAAAADALANATPTRSDPTRPGPCVTAMAPRSLPRRLASCSALFDDPADVANVLPRRELGHDAPPFAMDGAPATRSRSSGWPRAVRDRRFLQPRPQRFRRRRFRCRECSIWFRSRGQDRPTTV